MIFATRLPLRFWSKVYADEYGCWLWLGATLRGYGQFGLRRTANGFRTTQAHGLTYADLRGNIPDGLEPDHLCRIRPCVNPWHLEPVTHGENVRRSIAAIGHPSSNKTRCPSGHPYIESNTYIYRGKRDCRTCRRERWRRWELKRKTAKEVQA